MEVPLLIPSMVARRAKAGKSLKRFVWKHVVINQPGRPGLIWVNFGNVNQTESLFYSKRKWISDLYQSSQQTSTQFSILSNFQVAFVS